MDKLYISANELLLDSMELARKILISGFRPDFVVGVWRGGAPIAVAVQEYLAFKGHEADHIAVRTTSYEGIGRQRDVRVFGLEYLVENLSEAHSLLLVDGVFDSGRSIQAILSELEAQTTADLTRRTRIACPWYKPARNVTTRTPDYFLHQTDHWLVFPHELAGLSNDEIQRGKPEIYPLLKS